MDPKSLALRLRALMSELNNGFPGVWDRAEREHLRLRGRVPDWSSGGGDRDRYDSWEAQFAGWELSSRAQSYFTLTSLKEVTPFAISALRKTSDGSPVSAEYKYGYLLTRAPSSAP